MEAAARSTSAAVPGAREAPDGAASGLFSGYSPDEPRGLAGYAVLSLVFNAALAGVLVAGRDRLPDRIGAGDVLLMGVASHKFSRLLSKEKATSFLRAPFVRYEEDTGQGEVSESPRGAGLRRSIGELLICPYCLGQWVTGAYAGGLVFAPRVTRFLGSIYAGLTVSDFLQLAYKATQDKA